MILFNSVSNIKLSREHYTLSITLDTEDPRRGGLGGGGGEARSSGVTLRGRDGLWGVASRRGGCERECLSPLQLTMNTHLFALN